MPLSPLRPTSLSQPTGVPNFQESPLVELVMGDRSWLPALALLPHRALRFPHLAVPLISDSLDLNLFPPHLLWGVLSAREERAAGWWSGASHCAHECLGLFHGL